MDHILVGGGALSREILDWFLPGLAADGHRIVGYLDDAGEPMKQFGVELPKLGPIAGFRPSPSQLLVMAIATPRDKDASAAKLQAVGGKFATLVHPRAWVSASVKLGTGVVIAPFGLASANASVGDFTMINCYSAAGHDVTVGQSVTLSSHVDLTGEVKVGARSFFGSGSRVLPGVSIGEQCTIGAGAVVVRSVADDTTIYSSPGRKL